MTQDTFDPSTDGVPELDPLGLARGAASSYVECCQEIQDPEADAEAIAERATSLLHVTQAFSTLAVAEALGKLARRGIQVQNGRPRNA